MKKLLFVIVALVLLVGVASAISSNFQTVGSFLGGSGSGSLNGFIVYPGYGQPDVLSWDPITTGGNYYVNLYTQGGSIINAVANPTSYAAATLLGYDNAAAPTIVLYDASGTYIQGFLVTSTAGTRIEMKIVGGIPYIYKNGILVFTGGALSQNPSYVGFGNNGYNKGDVAWDDIVIGDSDNKYIFGAPDESQFVIVKDMINPSASGFEWSNNNTVISSYNMTTTYSYSNITAPGSQNVVLQSYGSASSGTIYGTYATGNYPSGSIAWPITDDLFNSGAPYGYYYTTIPNSGAISNVIAYIGNGATVAWGSKTYSQGDTATISYSISSSYFTSGYTYKMAIQDVYGNFISNKSITTQSGTVTNTFTTSNNQGVYYASLFATPIAGGSDILMNFDYTTLSGYITFTGTVYDAQTTNAISGAAVNILQSSNLKNTTSSLSGNYTISNYLTGEATTVNVTATGYNQYTYTFTPITTKTIQLDFALVPTSVAFSGVAIGGVARDTTYGSPIGGATVVVENLSTSEVYTKTANIRGWYLCDSGSLCSLVNSRVYSIFGSAYQHLNSSTYTVVAGGI